MRKRYKKYKRRSQKKKKKKEWQEVCGSADFKNISLKELTPKPLTCMFHGFKIHTIKSAHKPVGQ